jgi:hypothetical protein
MGKQTFYTDTNPVKDSERIPKAPTRDRGHRHEALDLLVVCDHRLTIIIE